MKLNFRLDKWDFMLLVTIFVAIGLFIVPSLYAGYLDWKRSYIAFFLEMIIALPVVILNVRVLMPCFFVKQRVWWYFPVLVLIIAPLIFAYNGLADLFYSYDPEIQKLHGFKMGRIGIFIWAQLRHVTIMSLVLIIRRLVFARQSIEELENEKRIIELNLLKSQLNPHFYFNTLNNLYSLTLQKSEKAPESILKLSKLMEYIIYDCKEEYININKEIEFLKNYIELEKLRYDEKVKIDLLISEEQNSLKIIPMILIQFVENVFKHGLSTNPAGYAKFNIEISAKKFIFIAENTFSESKNSSGIGIDSTRKRLQSYYPATHKLDISINENIFMVKLEIDYEND